MILFLIKPIVPIVVQIVNLSIRNNATLVLALRKYDKSIKILYLLNRQQILHEWQNSQINMTQHKSWEWMNRIFDGQPVDEVQIETVTLCAQFMNSFSSLWEYESPQWNVSNCHKRIASVLYNHGEEIFIWELLVSLQWRHNDPNGVSNHRRLVGLLNRLFRRRSKKTSKPRVTGLWEGNSPVTGEFPSQRASNAENVSIWWRHHGVNNREEVVFLSESFTNHCCSTTFVVRCWNIRR